MDNDIFGTGFGQQNARMAKGAPQKSGEELARELEEMTRAKQQKV